MKTTIKMLLGAALMGGVISTSAFAYTEQASAVPQIARPGVPAIARVVNPTGVPQRYEGATVDVAFTVDANGQARHVRVLTHGDPALARSLVAAVSKWEFTPAQKNGVAVATKVTMPLKLISGS